MAILLILWAIGLAFKVAGALIHLMLVVAFILVLIKLFSDPPFTDKSA